MNRHCKLCQRICYVDKPIFVNGRIAGAAAARLVCFCVKNYHFLGSVCKRGALTQAFLFQNETLPDPLALGKIFAPFPLLSRCIQHGREATEVHELDSGMHQLASKSEIETRLGANLPDDA